MKKYLFPRIVTKMQVEIKNLPGSEVEISGERDADTFEHFWAMAVKELGDKADIPGFRPGKIPERILVEKIGEGAVLEEAASHALEDAYPKILEEEKIEAIGRPNIVITKLARKNPLGFKIKTPVLPPVSLPDYKGIAKKVFGKPEEDLEVEDKEITQALEYLQKSREQNGELPELGDEFARTLGKFETLDALTQNVRESLTLEKKLKAREKRRSEAIDAIAREMVVDAPAILIDAEREKMIGELKGNLAAAGLEWAHYLDHIKKTEDDLRAEWKEEAEKRLRYGLALRAIGLEEHISVDREELEREMEYLASRIPEKERPQLDPVRLEDYAYSIARNEKIFRTLEDQAEK